MEMESKKEGQELREEASSGHFRAEYNYAKTQYRPRQDEYTRFMANYRGQYLDVSFEEDSSDVYPKLTRMAVGMAMSKILPVLLPVGGDFWEIEPSEIPDMFVSLMEAQELGVDDPALIAQYALQANERMRDRIRDNIQEMGYNTQVLDAALDLCLFGTMVWRGPMANPNKRKAWRMQKDGESIKIKKVEVDDSARPFYEHIPIRSFIPDPAATSAEDLNYGYIRHIMTSSQLHALSKRKGFRKEEIEEYLTSKPNGDYVPETEDQDEVAVNEEMTTDKVGRYEVLERWGWVDAEVLRNMGELPPDDDSIAPKMYQTWLVGEEVIFMKEMPYYEYPPFVVCPYEKMPGMLTGRGVAEQMEDPQSVMCSLVRALVDNIGFSVAPIGEIRVDKLAPGQGSPTVITPRRMFATRKISEHSDDGRQALNLYNVPVITNDIIQAMNFFMKLIEFQTSIPIAQGTGITMPGGSGLRTVGQATLMYQQAENFIRVVITNIDKYFVTPYIAGIYDWEMEYNPDMKIKGDFAVVARGAQGAMDREVEMQKINEVAATLAQGGPETIKWLKVPAYVDAINRRAQLKEQIVYSPEEMAAIEHQQQAMAAQMEYAKGDATKFKAQTPFSDALTQLASSMDDNVIAKPSAMAEAYRALGVESQQLYAALSIWAQEQLKRAAAEGAVEGEQAEVAGTDFLPPAAPASDKPSNKPSEEDAAQAEQQMAPAAAAGMANPDIEEMVRQAMSGKNISNIPAPMGGPGESSQPVEEAMPPVDSAPAPPPAEVVP